jgi:parallel beta-helix repeat protein
MKKQTFAKSVTLFFLVISLIGCIENSSNKSQGNIIYVDVTGGKDYTSIQDAINNANNGDSIIVSKGTYHEFLHVNKSINLKGSDLTIIYPNNVASNENSTIYVTADRCSIEGFKINNLNSEKYIIGINLHSSGNIILDNTISKFEYGVYIKGDINRELFTDNNISSNVISECTYGIYVRSDTENNSIFNNELFNNLEGMRLYYFVNNKIIDNYVHSNTLYGIYINLHSDGNIISGNICSENKYGIRFKGVSDNEIFLNKLEKNNLGLYSCCGSSDNVLYYNSLIDNNEHANDSFYNSWDNGIVGNYWDDYLEIYPKATQIDNFWDIPYKIPYGNNKDNFPLINPPILIINI